MEEGSCLHAFFVSSWDHCAKSDAGLDGLPWSNPQGPFVLATAVRNGASIYQSSVLHPTRDLEHTVVCSHPVCWASWMLPVGHWIKQA